MLINQDPSYATDYDTTKLVQTKIWGFDFNVTPRFIHLYVDRLFEPVSSRLVIALAQKMSPSKVFMDIGAHYGYYSLLVAKKTKVKTIMGVEPILENTTIFRQNTKANNFKHILIERVAISNTVGEKKIIIAHASDSSSFAPHPTGKKIGARIVRVTTIDKVAGMKRIGLIKLDVEGHELPAIEGAKRVIKTDQPAIMFEYHPISQRLAGHQDGDLLKQVLVYKYNLWAISEAKSGLVKLSPKGFLAHQQAVKSFGHEGYGNILALPQKSTFLKPNRDFIPMEEFSQYPLPGTGISPILRNRLDDTGIGFVAGQAPKVIDWDKWWLRHERDFYKQQFERADNEVKLFKQKWIYNLGQRVKEWVRV